MDTNILYIEHYVDLHNYISDNIYELNDDVIFTESIWKKVLIGGLAIGGIILLIKNWSKIMGFINKIMGKNIERTVRQARELIYKWVDSYSPKQLENFINHLKDKKMEKILSEVKNIYEGLAFGDSDDFKLYMLNDDISNYKKYNPDGEIIGNSIVTIDSEELLNKYATKVNINDILHNLNDRIKINASFGKTYELDDLFIGKIYQAYFKGFSGRISMKYMINHASAYKLSNNDIKEYIYMMIEILIYYYNSTVELFTQFNNAYDTFGSKIPLYEDDDVQKPIIDKNTGKQAEGYIDGKFVFFRRNYILKALSGLDNSQNIVSEIKAAINKNNWNKKEDLFTAIKTSVKSQLASFDNIAKVIKDRNESFIFVNLLRSIKILKIFLNNLSDLEKFMSEWINEAPKPEKSEKSDDEDNKK